MMYARQKPRRSRYSLEILHRQETGEAAAANQRARARSARGARSLTAGLDPF